MEEKIDLVRYVVTVPRSAIEKLRQLAKWDQRSQTQYVPRLIDQEFARQSEARKNDAA